MVAEAERFKAEDERVKAKIEAKNHLENYCHSIKSSLREDKVASVLGENDKKTVEDAVNDTLSWMDGNVNAEKEEFEERQKRLEGKVMPIMQKLGGGGPGSGPNYNYSTPEGPKTSNTAAAADATGPKIDEVD
jgi:heat shock protein 1/8